MLKMTQKCQYRQRLQKLFVIECKFGKIRDFAVDNNCISLSNALTSAEFSSTKWATADRHEESKAIFKKNRKLHVLLDTAYRAQ